uniref:Protein kinase domain-containing protein n=1 Tax=Trichuris muris TaxID=70415 RepID=A0A5S6QVX9_TRIMR
MAEANAHCILKPKDRVDNWEVVRELGFGTFGAVYEVINLKTNAKEAMKVEKRGKDESNRTLKLEIQVLKELTDAKARNCCTLMGSGRKPEYSYMVMTLVGPSFESVLNKLQKLKGCGKMNSYSAMYACVFALEGLEDLHKAKYVHRDVKPQNFSVGEGALIRNIYVLDFGTARRFLKDNGKHHRPRARCGFRGTTLFASVTALNGEEQSRRDDLWSWFFVLVRLTTGTLPWLNLKPPAGFDEQLKMYADAKAASIDSPGKMLECCPPSYTKILDLMKKLTYYSVPEYNNVYSLLKEEMNKCHPAGQQPALDWENN